MTGVEGTKVTGRLWKVAKERVYYSICGDYIIKLLTDIFQWLAGGDSWWMMKWYWILPAWVWSGLLGLAGAASSQNKRGRGVAAGSLFSSSTEFESMVLHALWVHLCCPQAYISKLESHSFLEELAEDGCQKWGEWCMNGRFRYWQEKLFMSKRLVSRSGNGRVPNPNGGQECVNGLVELFRCDVRGPGSKCAHRSWLLIGRL